VTQVCAAFFAMNLNPVHAMTGIGGGFDGQLGNRFEKTGPTGAGLEFRIGIEQRLTATDTEVLTMLMAIPVFATEGALGAVLPSNAVLFLAELLLPIGVGLIEFVCHCRCT
jgi:hypothetical protein